MLVLYEDLARERAFIFGRLFRFLGLGAHAGTRGDDASATAVQGALGAPSQKLHSN